MKPPTTAIRPGAAENELVPPTSLHAEIEGSDAAISRIGLPVTVYFWNVAPRQTRLPQVVQPLSPSRRRRHEHGRVPFPQPPGGSEPRSSVPSSSSATAQVPDELVSSNTGSPSEWSECCKQPPALPCPQLVSYSATQLLSYDISNPELSTTVADVKARLTMQYLGARHPDTTCEDD